MIGGAMPTLFEPRSADLLRLVYVDASPLAAGTWRLTIGFAPLGGEQKTIPAIPPDALHLAPVDGQRHARLRATRTAWAQPGRVLSADVALHGASTAGGVYLLRIESPTLVDPASAAARFLAPEASVEDDAGSAPALDYLTKDYFGFRHLMLSSINRLLPRWGDGSEADLGVTIVESLAYGADFLSYHQDAVATEAYLDTARQRTSIRRHLRLLGYRLGEGCASRLLLRLVATPGASFGIPAGIAYTAGPDGPSVADADDPAVTRTLADGRVVYTQITDAIVSAELNQLKLAAPGRLRAGRTHFPVLSSALADVMTAASGGLFGIVGTTTLGTAIFHPFRALSVVPSKAPAVAGRSLYVIEADPDDGLSCDLEDGAVIIGNLVAAEFGRLVRGEVLPAPTPALPYRPTLAVNDVVPVAPVDRKASALALLAPTPETAVAAVTLREILPTGFDVGELGGSTRWLPTTDLLGCSATARRFVVETEVDGTASLRFGDGSFGRRPPTDTRLVADYRVGRLTAAVVGTGQLDTLVAPTRQMADDLRPRILSVSNPIPSQGLHHPEPETRAILHGKAGFRIVQTCVTLADFAAAAERVPTVAEAVTSVHRAGAAEVIVIRVRATGDLFVAEPLLDKVRRAVAGQMLPGRRLAVLGPRFARLAIGVTIRPEGGADPDRVRRAVETALSARTDGLFAPERLAFGQTIFASRILQVTAGLAGVAAARLMCLERIGAAEKAIPAKLDLAPDEIPVVAQIAVELEARR